MLNTCYMIVVSKQYRARSYKFLDVMKILEKHRHYCIIPLLIALSDPEAPFESETEQGVPPSTLVYTSYATLWLQGQNSWMYLDVTSFRTVNSPQFPDIASAPNFGKFTSCSIPEISFELVSRLWQRDSLKVFCFFRKIHSVLLFKKVVVFLLETLSLDLLAIALLDRKLCSRSRPLKICQRQCILRGCQDCFSCRRRIDFEGKLLLYRQHTVISEHCVSVGA